MNADGMLDIGHGVSIAIMSWHPDRELNPQYADIPDIERFAVLVRHSAPDGGECASAAKVDSPEARRLEPDGPKWTVESWDPLTLSPSLLCRRCGHHGFIREGRWVPA